MLNRGRSAGLCCHNNKLRCHRWHKVDIMTTLGCQWGPPVIYRHLMSVYKYFVNKIYMYKEMRVRKTRRLLPNCKFAVTQIICLQSPSKHISMMSEIQKFDKQTTIRHLASYVASCLFNLIILFKYKKTRFRENCSSIKSQLWSPNVLFILFRE